MAVRISTSLAREPAAKLGRSPLKGNMKGRAKSVSQVASLLPEK
jgi:hypothetical protein